MKYISRETRCKWKEEKEVLYLNELEKKCDDLIKEVNIELATQKETLSNGTV